MVRFNDISTVALGEPPLCCAQGSKTSSRRLELPVITPLRDLKAGEELFLEVPAVEKPPREKRVHSWESAAKKAASESAAKKAKSK